MISVLRGLFMPDDSLSAVDKAVIAFFEIVAFALGWSGIDRLLAGTSLSNVLPIFVATILSSYAGFKWPWIKGRFVSVDWGFWTKRISLILQIVLLLSFTAVVIIGYYAFRKASIASNQNAPKEQVSKPTNAPAVPSPVPKSHNVPVAPPTKPRKEKDWSESPETSSAPPSNSTVSYSVIIDPKKITALDADQIAKEGQHLAARILACLADSNDTDICLGVYASDITEFRDEFHNRGIEIPELNEVVNELESHPSKK
jgi:hypothetical protein